MRVIWLSWKDLHHPLAGGAEVVTDQLLTRLAADGHEVTLVTAGYEGADPQGELHGYSIKRFGNRFTVYAKARRYLKQAGEIDVLIEEINTIPFFSGWVRPDTKRFLFFHMLAREIWFYQMFFPASLIGYLLEPIYLRLLSGHQVITVSESTKKDLIRNGFEPERISIISEGINLQPLKSLTAVSKYSQPTVLSLGAIRPMKRTLDQIKAFEAAKKALPNLTLKVAGLADGKYGAKVNNYIERSPYKDAIECLGKVDHQTKIELFQKSHVIMVTSVKEGWGLIVTEANSQGTPAAVYNVDGLRDSVKDGITGQVARRNTPKELGKAVATLLADKQRYEQLRQSAWEWSKTITFERCYSDFLAVIER